MVMLYVGGKHVGALDDIERLLELIATRQKVELRDDAGQSIAVVTPTPPVDPDEPPVPWNPSITREELDRRAAGLGFTIDELRERLGWK